MASKGLRVRRIKRLKPSMLPLVRQLPGYESYEMIRLVISCTNERARVVGWMDGTYAPISPVVGMERSLSGLKWLGWALTVLTWVIHQTHCQVGVWGV